MTQREQLIKLIETGNDIATKKILSHAHQIVKEKHRYDSAKDRLVPHQELVADYLLNNGVIVLPCKVGDTVWELCKCDDGVSKIFPMEVTKVLPYGSVRWVKEKEPTVWNVYAISDYTDMYKNFYDFGKTVFLTKAEAEKALRKREE